VERSPQATWTDPMAAAGRGRCKTSAFWLRQLSRRGLSPVDHLPSPRRLTFLGISDTPPSAKCARMSDMPKRKRRKFTPEQKADAVRLVREVGTVAQVARDLDLTETALARWVRQAKIDEGNGKKGTLTTDERKELQRLRRENLTLQMERDFLKKAAAFFAKEQDRPTS